jgi:hypothetical protein
VVALQLSRPVIVRVFGWRSVSCDDPWSAVSVRGDTFWFLRAATDDHAIRVQLHIGTSG